MSVAVDADPRRRHSRDCAAQLAEDERAVAYWVRCSAAVGRCRASHTARYGDACPVEGILRFAAAYREIALALRRRATTTGSTEAVVGIEAHSDAAPSRRASPARLPIYPEVT